MSAAVCSFRRPAVLIGCATLVLGLFGCGKAAAPVESSHPTAVLKSATLRVGQAVPAPSGKVVLTLTGNIAQHNRGGSLAWDMAGLEQLGVVEVTVDDPWAKKSVTLRGVWLADLLKIAQASISAGVDISALDDYKVHLSAKDIAAGGILLATETADGQAIPIEDGGPTRIVFANGVPAGANPDQWIWSLKTLTVT